MKTKGHFEELASLAGMFMKNKYLALQSGNVVENKWVSARR
jgi:hypothetical protein